MEVVESFLLADLFGFQLLDGVYAIEEDGLNFLVCQLCLVELLLSLFILVFSVEDYALTDFLVVLFYFGTTVQL